MLAMSSYEHAMGKLSICQCRYIHAMGLYVSVYSAMQMLHHAIQLVQDAMGALSSLYAVLCSAMQLMQVLYSATKLVCSAIQCYPAHTGAMYRSI